MVKQTHTHGLRLPATGFAVALMTFALLAIDSSMSIASSQSPAPAKTTKSPAPPPPTPAATTSVQPALPSPETMLALIRTHLLALDHAIRTNNFYVLHALGGPLLQARITPEQLSNAFANLKQDKPNLAAVAIATPNLSREPQIEANGLLRLIGSFPTEPKQIRFEMLYQAASGEWRLAGMNVAIAAPAATDPAVNTATKPGSTPPSAKTR